MSNIYMQNYGISKTILKDSFRNINNKHTFEMQGNYDGNKANIHVTTNNNGNYNSYNIQLDNNDILDLLSIQPINMSLENRLKHDFLQSNNYNKNIYQPIILEGILDKHIEKTYRNRKHKSTKKNRYSNYNTTKHYNTFKHL